MGLPRKVYSLSTQYFDFLFSKESTGTAKAIADKADNFYLQAKKDFENDYDFKTLVVISPDSDVLSVRYSPVPYNRIIVYEGKKQLEQEVFSAGLLDLFRYEVIRAVSQSVKSEFVQKASKIIGGDSFQPVALMNMPFSFLEGAINANLEEDGIGLLNDNWNLQILMQMKLENIFPSLMQLNGAMDIYPGEKFSQIAGSAFCAYIQQRWGIEKFLQFWAESGKIHFFKMNKWIFEQIYGQQIEVVWNDFLESIPQPQVIEDNSSFFFDFDNDSVYKFLMHTPYGFVWYDKLKQEVDIYDDYSNIKLRQFLFLAADVTNLYTTPDGRYLIISYIRKANRENLKKNITEVYDLKERTFVSARHLPEWKENLLLEDVENAFGGEDFSDEIGIYSKTILDKNTVAALFCKNNQWFTGIYNYTSGSRQYFQIRYCDEILKIHNLRRIDGLKAKQAADKKRSLLLFDFILQNEASFARTGALILEKASDSVYEGDYLPVEAFVLDQDFSGGINDGIIFDDKLYYFAHKFNCDEFRYTDIKNLSYSPAEILVADIVFPLKSLEKKPEIVQKENQQKENQKKESQLFLENYEISKYNPWGLMFKGDWKPFFPVYDINFEKELEFHPGLGVTFQTQSDPFANNKIFLSAGAMILPMEFTKLFNGTEKSKEELKAQKNFNDKDIAFCAYAVNSSTPADISLGGLYKFNPDGEYDFKAILRGKVELPCRMTFRRIKMELMEAFTGSTSYWDSHQKDYYPDLTNWPSLTDSYRSWQSIFSVEYTNLHQYGLSPLKKMGLETGMLITATWDLNLMELQQQWRWPYSPTQINLGMYALVEIPYIMPFQNYKGWILSFPLSLEMELFYTNGTALKTQSKMLLLGKELQTGFNKINIYFPRFGLYGGYEVSLDYDTNTIVLPDLRDFTRFYDVLSNCYMNDSVFVNLELYTTPVAGKFAVDQLVTNVTFQYYLRTKEIKLSCNFELLIK